MEEGGDEGTRGWRNEAKHPVPLPTTHLMLRHLAAMLHGGVHGAAQHEGLGQAGVRLDVHAHLGRPVREVAWPPEIAAPPGVDVDDLHGQARPGTAQYSPVQPDTAQYSPVRPDTAQYSPVRPSTTQYGPVRLGPAGPRPPLPGNGSPRSRAAAAAILGRSRQGRCPLPAAILGGQSMVNEAW